MTGSAEASFPILQPLTNNNSPLLGEITSVCHSCPSLSSYYQPFLKSMCKCQTSKMFVTYPSCVSQKAPATRSLLRYSRDVFRAILPPCTLHWERPEQQDAHPKNTSAHRMNQVPMLNPECYWYYGLSMDDRRWGGDISNPNCIISQKKSGSRLTWLKITHIGIFTSIDRISRRVNKELCENERSVPEMCAPNKPLKGLSKLSIFCQDCCYYFISSYFWRLCTDNCWNNKEACPKDASVLRTKRVPTLNSFMPKFNSF